jgi:hypothetical protein
MAESFMFQAIRCALLLDRCGAVAKPGRAKLADRVATLMAESRQRRRLDRRRLRLVGGEIVIRSIVGG